MELIDVPEPVMAQFDRLPLPMQMRVAAEVLRKVNQRCVSGGRRDVAVENWWPTKIKEFAEIFDREDTETCPNDDLRCSCAFGKGHRAILT